MSQPLRRRLRTHLLAALSHLGEFVPRRAFHATLERAARLLRGSVYADRARQNLLTAYGLSLEDGEREELLQEVFRHGARLFAEWLRLARCGGDASGTRGSWIDDTVELDPSVDTLRRLHERGRGCIVVTPHLGNWELLAARLRRAGFDGAVVGRKRARDSSADWMVAMRRAYGVRTIPQDASPRELLAVLRRGGVLGLLPDLEVRRLAGDYLPFFGVPALTMTAPAALARAHDVPLVPARCVLPRAARRTDRYVLSVGTPLELDRALGRREATLELTQRLNDVFETWIRETPEQWAWHQHRWRTRPGEFVPLPLAEHRRRNTGL